MESPADVGLAAIAVVIVDKQVLTATCVATALATKPDITVLGVADSCATGLTAVSEHRPDVLLLDQRLPDGGRRRPARSGRRMRTDEDPRAHQRRH